MKNRVRRPAPLSLSVLPPAWTVGGNVTPATSFARACSGSNETTTAAHNARARMDAPPSAAGGMRVPPCARRGNAGWGRTNPWHCPAAVPHHSSRMDIGRVGIWTFSLELQPAARAQEAAAEIESLGYPARSGSRRPWAARPSPTPGCCWPGRRRLVVATGIANVWGRDAMAMAAARRTLDEAYPGRFLLGLGVSHAPLVEGMRGHRYDKPSQLHAQLPRRDGRGAVHGVPAKHPAPARHRCAGAEDAGAGGATDARRASVLRAAGAYRARPRDHGQGPAARARSRR